jgi:hypothetical protein
MRPNRPPPRRRSRANTPTISATVGHLEARWNFVALIVVALIVIAADQTSRSARVARLRRRRPKTGRFTMSPARTANDFQELSPYFYFPVALTVVVGGAWWIIEASNDKWVRGYVIYGLIAVLFVIIPSVMAAFLKTDVPFLTLFRTIDKLERHWHPASLVVLTGLVILLIHLAFYPWPDIVKPPTTGSP